MIIWGGVLWGMILTSTFVNMFTYRKEIDGLRAIAVLSVIFCHSKFDIFKGGFIGVDVFFVISGYLITSILLNKINDDSFSFKEFYLRRIKRLFPALFTILILSSIPSYFLMLPDEFENFGQSIIATLGFSNNILLFLTTGYWQIDSEFKPLLHTWSLGVEEQFYLFFPLLIYFFLKNKSLNKLNSILFILLFVSFSSLFILENIIHFDTFYLMPTRLWEFIFGGIVAIKNTNDISKNHNVYLSYVGFTLILLSVFLFNDNTSLIFLIIPVVGVSLILMNNDTNNILYKILTIPILRKIGFLSYSAYLVHVPLFSYVRLYSEEEPSSGIYIILIFTTILISYLIFKFIENPFRRNVYSNNFLRKFLIITFTYLIIFSVPVVYSRGFGNFFYGEDGYGENKVWREYNQKINNLNYFTKPSEGIKVLILGSSYARDIANSLLETYGSNEIQISYSVRYYDCDFIDLEKINPDIEEQFKKSQVIIFGSGSLSKECVEKTIKNIESLNKKVYYTGYKNFGYNLNHLKFKKVFRPDIIHFKSKRLTKEIDLNNHMRQIIPKENFISIMDLISENNFVTITDKEGKLLSVDRTHLTKPGAVFIGTLLKKESTLGIDLLINQKKE